MKNIRSRRRFGNKVNICGHFTIFLYERFSSSIMSESLKITQEGGKHRVTAFSGALALLSSSLRRVHLLQSASWGTSLDACDFFQVLLLYFVRIFLLVTKSVNNNYHAFKNRRFYSCDPTFTVSLRTPSSSVPAIDRMPASMCELMLPFLQVSHLPGASHRIWRSTQGRVVPPSKALADSPHYTGVVLRVGVH